MDSTHSNYEQRKVYANNQLETLRSYGFDANLITVDRFCDWFNIIIRINGKSTIIDDSSVQGFIQGALFAMNNHETLKTNKKLCPKVSLIADSNNIIGTHTL